MSFSPTAPLAACVRALTPRTPPVLAALLRLPLVRTQLSAPTLKGREQFSFDISRMLRRGLAPALSESSQLVRIERFDGAKWLTARVCVPESRLDLVYLDTTQASAQLVECTLPQQRQHELAAPGPIVELVGTTATGRGTTMNFRVLALPRPHAQLLTGLSRIASEDQIEMLLGLESDLVELTLVLGLHRLRPALLADAAPYAPGTLMERALEARLAELELAAQSWATLTPRARHVAGVLAETWSASLAELLTVASVLELDTV